MASFGSVSQHNEPGERNQIRQFAEGESGRGGMNVAGMMTGMAMGGALGQQMGNMMNQMGAAMNGQMGMPPSTGLGAGAPPTLPTAPVWMIAINGQQSGPFSVQQLQQLAAGGQLSASTYVWKQGMANWDTAGNVPELAALFASQTPPPPPGMPPVTPT